MGEKIKMSCPVCGQTVGFVSPHSDGTIQLKCQRCKKKFDIKLDSLSYTVIKRRATVPAAI